MIFIVTMCLLVIGLILNGVMDMKIDNFLSIKRIETYGKAWENYTAYYSYCKENSITPILIYIKILGIVIPGVLLMITRKVYF